MAQDPLTDNREARPLTVSEALEKAKSSLESISLSVIGEVSELSNRPSYKAIYFTLSDQSSALACVIWRNVYERQGIELAEGMLVEVTGRFTLYAAKGRMNFDVRSIKPVGEGDLRMRVAALANRLRSEGLMAPGLKQPVPQMPERIGIVTSPHGKAIHDVLRTLKRRWPLAELVFAGVTVEGEAAVGQILQGLAAVQAQHPEVILLVRGGGSYEDLMPFNDERLARAVALSPLPIVTGIGHEPDISIADMVADLAASTPTAAAEHVSPDIQELKAWLKNATQRVDTSLLGYYSQLRRGLDRQASHPLFNDATHLLRQRWVNLEHGSQRLSLSAQALVLPFKADVSRLAAQLSALSPVGILARGYALALAEDGRLVRSAAEAKPGSQLTVQLADGQVVTEVKSVGGLGVTARPLAARPETEPPTGRPETEPPTGRPETEPPTPCPQTGPPTG